MSQNDLQNGATPLIFLAPFWVIFPVCFFQGAKGPPREPKSTILVPKMDPQSSKNGVQETLRDLENAIHVIHRVIPTIIPKSANVYKQTSNCAGLYLRRSTSKWCCGGVPRSVFNPPQHPPGAVRRVESLVICLSKSYSVLRGAPPMAPTPQRELFKIE